MPMRIRVAGQTDPGQLREINEDSFYYKIVEASDEEALGLFIVADGMGGHLAGEVASMWAVESLKRELSLLFKPRDPRATLQLTGGERQAMLTGEQTTTKPLAETETQRLIRAAIERANSVVLRYARKKPDEAEGMGSTVTLAVVEQGMATIANVGDSRTYLWHDGELRQITEDHSLTASLIAAGSLPPEAIYDDPQRHIIYRCLGLESRVEVDLFLPIQLQSGDSLLLCSDGLWEMLRSPQPMVDVLNSVPDPTEACHQLVQMANDAGGEDNISVVVARFE
jgi:serine/threonine protein phosphatase PrpC